MPKVLERLFTDPIEEGALTKALVVRVGGANPNEQVVGSLAVAISPEGQNLSAHQWHVNGCNLFQRA